MTKFLEKLQNKISPSDIDMYEHIDSSGRYASGDSERALGSLLIQGEIKNSYEHLIDGLEFREKQVADLGCGSGALVRICSSQPDVGNVYGIDRSLDEIGLARKKSQRKNEIFLCEQVQKTSLEASSIDIILSHYGYLIFRPLDLVDAEISRIASSTAVFVTNVHSDVTPIGLGARIFDLAYSFQNYVSNFNSIGWGDLKSIYLDSIKSRFEKFRMIKTIEASHYDAVLPRDGNELKNLKDIFQIGYFLNPDQQAQYLKELTKILGEDPREEIRIPMQKIQVWFGS